MNIIDVLFDAICGLQVFCGITIINDNRLSIKKRMPCMLILMGTYIFIDYSQVSFTAIVGAFITVLEVAMMIYMSFYMTEGDKWLNTTYVLFSIVLNNVVWSVLGLVIPAVQGAYSRILIRESTGVRDISVIFIVSIFCVVLNCNLLKGIKRKQRFVTEKLARGIFLLISAVSILAFFYKLVVLSSDELEKNNKIYVIVSIVLNILLFVIIIALILRIYDKTIMEDKNKYLEKQERQNEYYRSLVESNLRLKQIRDDYRENMYSVASLGTDRYNTYVTELKEKLEVVNAIPLSGILTLDATIAECYRKACRNDIVFECSIAPLVDNYDEIDKFVNAIGDVLEKALMYCEKSKNPSWMNLSVRQKNNMLAFNVEFSKKVIDNISRENYNFKYIRELIENASGAFVVSSKKDRAQLSGLLPVTMSKSI